MTQITSQREGFVLQGALDGGLDIPHGDKRFVGYDTEGKKLDPEQLKRYIMGGHVSAYCITMHHMCMLNASHPMPAYL